MSKLAEGGGAKKSVARTSTRHICAVQYDHSAHRTPNALGSRPGVSCKHLCATISFVIWCVTCLVHGCSLTRLPPWALPLLHLPILPHNENTQYIPHISKITQSISNAIKNHSGVKTCRMDGNPRITTPTGYELKELATVSRIEAYSGDPYQSYDVQEKLEKKITELLSPKKWRNVEKIKTAGVPDSKLSETSYIQSQMHFGDSVESIADSDLEDGELQKMLTSPLYAQKASGKPDAMVTQEREVSAQYTQANRMESVRSHSSESHRASVNFFLHVISPKSSRLSWEVSVEYTQAGKESLRSRSSEGQSFGWTRYIVFIWTGKPDQEFCVQKRLSVELGEDLFLKVIRITCSIRQDQTWPNKNFTSNLSISASVTYNYKWKRKDWHYRTHSTDLLNPKENKFDYKKN